MKSLEKLVKIQQAKLPAPPVYMSHKLPNKEIYPTQFYHELSHILQFKQNEINRWRDGYLKFSHFGGGHEISSTSVKPIKSKTFKPFKRELESMVIHYLYLENKSNYINKNWIGFKFKNKDVSTMLEKAMKKHKKRVIKKRIQFINKSYEGIVNVT